MHWSASSQKSPTRKPRLLIDLITGTVSRGWPSCAVQVDNHLDDDDDDPAVVSFHVGEGSMHRKKRKKKGGEMKRERDLVKG